MKCPTCESQFDGYQFIYHSGGKATSLEHSSRVCKYARERGAKCINNCRNVDKSKTWSTESLLDPKTKKTLTEIDHSSKVENRMLKALGMSKPINGVNIEYLEKNYEDRRKDLIDETIVSLLQDCGPLTLPYLTNFLRGQFLPDDINDSVTNLVTTNVLIITNEGVLDVNT